MTKLADRLKEPLDTRDKRIVTIVGAFFLVAFALVNYGTIRAATRGCVDGIRYGSGLDTASTTVGSDTAISTDTARMCSGRISDPSTSELLLGLGAEVPSVLFSAIALLLLCRFLWGAARPGLHSPVTPGRLRTLGWFVLVVGPLTEALQHFLRYEMAGHLAENTAAARAGKAITDINGYYSAWMQELQMNFPWWCVFAGISALVVAKLLRIEVRMAEDLEGTI